MILQHLISVCYYHYYYSHEIIYDVKSFKTYPDYHRERHDAKLLLLNLMSDELKLDLCQSNNQQLEHQRIDLQHMTT